MEPYTTHGMESRSLFLFLTLVKLLLVFINNSRRSAAAILEDDREVPNNYAINTISGIPTISTTNLPSEGAPKRRRKRSSSTTIAKKARRSEEKRCYVERSIST